ncbi:protein GAMETE EXPRESSED 2 isoform X1 [Tripterygium wilfordii]|uniref:protein GAMETE EXPRESSED 2 isoform X1 n=2 Tax=Tripterygium wilfordii TaxID=458696 RepID=UPI0018F7F551|nr:protein GAMETE EXPRESSED 2 isoform X1 [Tripterygium wilfordii]
MALPIHPHMAMSLPALALLVATVFQLASSDEGTVPKFAFSWWDDKNTFQAGVTATIKIKVLGEFDSKGNASLEKSAFSPTISVNGKMGNSSYISGVLLLTEEDTGNWKILFTPIMVGLFNVIINEEPFEVFDSSLHFNVTPGPIYPSVCVASWMGLANEFEVGAKATILILPKDAFGNNALPTGEELNSYNFMLRAHYLNGSIASVPNITYVGWNEVGNILIDFIMVKSGDLLMHVQGGNQSLNGSPLTFKVNPGPLDVSNCVAQLKFETNAWQLFSRMEILIYQHDRYRNLVPGKYEFDADIVEKETNLSMPVADLHFEEVAPGIQLFSFSILEPGNFWLTISNTKHNKSISNMPYAYTAFIGYCDGLKSIVNGSGLNDSIAGEMVKFSVYLNDIFQYPSPVEVERLQVQIVKENDSYSPQPTICPMQIINGSIPTPEWNYVAISQIANTPAPSIAPSTDLSNTSFGSSKVQVSAFSVIFTPEKSGIYQIYVFCGNILLNGGPFTKEVKAGEVNVSLSGNMRFAPKVPKLVKNEILVQLVDSYSNPVPLQQSRLNLEIASTNRSGFSSWMFVDNNNGSYTGCYLANDVGTYEMCVSFDGERLNPCPFGVNVYSGEYFPKAYDDNISIWEDESIAFDVLANDYFAGDNATIIEFSKPGHGSLLQHGQLLRYTPYKDYYGNDSFSYSISDVNGNLASATASIFVLSIPPHFVSFPSQLQATEDILHPRFGGFSGFEIRYSDPTENISVVLSARSGTIFLSPMMMQFWQPMGSGLSVKHGDEEAKDLILEGCVEVINLALQSIQYLGNENFCGEDSIRVSARNRNGPNDLDVPVFVEPVNDPPFIRVPGFIVLKSNGEESLIFDKFRDKFEFSVGDPDLLNFPGGESQFLVAFSVEVNDGFLMASLPADLINTTELMLMSSYQWQPLQTYVTISKHFMVKANGIRFRGTLNECNTVLQQLLYHGGEHGALLTIKLNDMGHYGCYLDCAEGISMPLHAVATIKLIRRRPMSSLVAHTLGSAIVIESLLVLFLGVLLLFLTCKCALLLFNERSIRKTSNLEPSKVQNVQKETSSGDYLSENATTCFTGCCSSSSLLSGQPSNFRQRSRSGIGKSKGQLFFPSYSSSDQIPPPSFMPLSIEKKPSETA